MDIETLAKDLHEAGREAVAQKAVVNPNTFSKFLEWDELEEHMKEGRRIQARYLLDHYLLFPKTEEMPALIPDQWYHISISSELPGLEWWYKFQDGTTMRIIQKQTEEDE